MNYAVFNRGRQVSKSHSTREAAFQEAFELGLVKYAQGQQYLDDGVSIEQVNG